MPTGSSFDDFTLMISDTMHDIKEQKNISNTI